MIKGTSCVGESTPRKDATPFSQESDDGSTRDEESSWLSVYRVSFSAVDRKDIERVKSSQLMVSKRFFIV